MASLAQISPKVQVRDANIETETHPAWLKLCSLCGEKGVKGIGLSCYGTEAKLPDRNTDR